MRTAYVVIAHIVDNDNSYTSLLFDYEVEANAHAKLISNELDQKTAKPKYKDVRVLPLTTF